MIKPKGKKGTYWCDFYDLNGGRVRLSLHTSDKKEAQQAEAKLIADLEVRFQNRKKGGISLKDAFRHALRVRDEWRSAKSMRSIHQVYGMVEAHFGETCSLSELDDEVLLEYGEQLHDEELTASTINKRFWIISVLFDEAIKWKKYIGRKPSITRYKVSNGRRRVITPLEKVTVISLCNQDSPYESAMADLIIVLADTGLRLSEALNIIPRNVNLEAHTVLVVDTKTGGDRRVPLTPQAEDVLARRTVAPLFAPLNTDNLSHIWRRIRRKMGLEHDREFVLHAFRHTYGSTLANAGVDSFRIQKVMGHKTIQTTERYVHVSDNALEGLADVIKSGYAQKCAQKEPKDDVNMTTTREQPAKTDSYPGSCWTVNPQVPGSSPGRGAKLTSGISISYTLKPPTGRYGN